MTKQRLIYKARTVRAREELETAVQHAHELNMPVGRSAVVRAAAADLITAIEAELP